MKSHNSDGYRKKKPTSFSFTVAVLASIGGRGGATVGRLIMAGAGRITELIASCD